MGRGSPDGAGGRRDESRRRQADSGSEWDAASSARECEGYEREGYAGGGAGADA